MPVCLFIGDLLEANEVKEEDVEVAEADCAVRWTVEVTIGSSVTVMTLMDHYRCAVEPEKYIKLIIK